MYVPKQFEEKDIEKLHAFIATNSFGVLVSNSTTRFEATHVPLLLERDAGSHGQLLGHLARANTQWKKLDGERCLAVFSGPHTYVSATWYEEKDVVPSWNYVAVHVHGTFRLDDSKQRRLEIIRRTTDFYEQSFSHPWTIDDASSEFIERIADAVVGFRIEIERIEGNWKLNQHHPPEKRARVVKALKKNGGAQQLAIAALMDRDVPK